MNQSTANNGHTPKSPAQRLVEDRFDVIEQGIAQLKDLLSTARQAQHTQLAPTETRQIHLAKTRALLAQKKEITVADVRAELNVTVKTATRLLHAMSQGREGVLIFEPIGHTERLVLLHPSKVAIERTRAN